MSTKENEPIQPPCRQFVLLLLLFIIIIYLFIYLFARCNEVMKLKKKIEYTTQQRERVRDLTKQFVSVPLNNKVTKQMHLSDFI